MLTLRPDAPYPFLAGQYTTLETPWWPRVWRHYSFASAPRPDGLLTLHVKSVPAGWVSQALVHRARPGDVLRLGPPAGSMTVDHDTDTSLVCLGGGTGIAPITQAGSLAAQINQAALAGRRGETVLLSLIAFGGDRLASTDPAALTAALGGLTSVGLGHEAHDIALQAAVLIGL